MKKVIEPEEEASEDLGFAAGCCDAYPALAKIDFCTTKG
jgi:hypothetical protein